MDAAQARLNAAQWHCATGQAVHEDGLKSPNNCCFPPATPDSAIVESFPADPSPPHAQPVFSGDWTATLGSGLAGTADSFGVANEAYPYHIAPPAVDHFLPAAAYGWPPAIVHDGQFVHMGGHHFLHHQQLSGPGIHAMQPQFVFSPPAFGHWSQPAQLQHQLAYGEMPAPVSAVALAPIEAPVRVYDRDGTAYTPGFQPSVFQPVVPSVECSFPSATASAWSPATEDSIAMAATPASAPVFSTGEQPVVDEPTRCNSEPFSAFPAPDRGFSAKRAAKGPTETADDVTRNFSPWVDLNDTHPPAMLATPILETAQAVHHDGTVSPADLHITPPYTGQVEAHYDDTESSAFVAREGSSISGHSGSISARGVPSSPGAAEAQSAKWSDSPPAPKRVPLPRPLTPSFFADETGYSPSSYAEEPMATEDSDMGPVTAQPSPRPTTETPARPYVAGFPPPPTNREEQDALLLQLREVGHSYKQIKAIGLFQEAESTLRGRWRTLTKPKEERVRRPRWTDIDDRLLVAAVHQLVQGGRPPQDPSAAMRVSWKAVADFIEKHGGSYRFGNTTCHKRWNLLQSQGRV